MNLVIDAGNTLLKAALFEQDILHWQYQTHSLNDLKAALQPYMPQMQRAIIASVQVEAQHIADTLALSIPFLLFEPQTPVPVKILYETPHSLGVDRLAVVAAAQQVFPKQNCLVIQVGTCITYDYIDAAAHYHGGGISLGLSMRFAALHHFTARLPLVQPAAVDLIGTTTEKSIQSGVIHGMVAEIEGIIDQYREKYAPLQLMMSGGDTFFFESKIKHNIFAMPYAVLYGLNTILNYNALAHTHQS